MLPTSACCSKLIASPYRSNSRFRTVSEETGSLSVAQRGVLHRDLDGDGVRRLLEASLIAKDDEEFSETAKLLAESPQENADEGAEGAEGGQL